MLFTNTNNYLSMYYVIAPTTEVITINMKVETVQEN